MLLRENPGWGDECRICSGRALTVGDEDPPATLARSDCGRGIAATIRASGGRTILALTQRKVDLARKRSHERPNARDLAVLYLEPFHGDEFVALAATERGVNLRHGQAPLHRARTAGELSQDSHRSQSACERAAVAARRATARNDEFCRACEFDSRGAAAGDAGRGASARVLSANSRGGYLWRTPTHGPMGRSRKRTPALVRAPQAHPGRRAAGRVGARSQTVSSTHHPRARQRRVRRNLVAVLTAKRGYGVWAMEGDRLRDVFERIVARRTHPHRRDATRVLTLAACRT